VRGRPTASHVSLIGRGAGWLHRRPRAADALRRRASQYTRRLVPEPDENRPLPVLVGEVEPLPAERPAGSLVARIAALPAPVIAATGGFLAGFATIVLVRVLRRRHDSRLVRRLGRRKGIEIQGTKSFLVDVHLLKR